MDIQLIAMDMDGTTFDTDHLTVPPRNIAALRAAAARGVTVAITSGRTWSQLRDAAEQIGCVSYALMANGASCWDVARRTWLWNTGIPDGQRRALVNLLLDKGLPFEAYAHGDSYIPWERKEATLAGAPTAGYRETVRNNSLFPFDLAAALEGQVVEKLHIFHVPPQARSALAEEIRAAGPIGLDSAFGENLELVAPGVNKAVAAERLCARLVFGPEQVMAFGDAANDEPLLRWAGWSFAVENATEGAKRAAKHLTGSNHAAGVGMAIEQYLLEG